MNLVEYSVPQRPDLRGPGRESGSGGGVASLGSVISDRFLELRTVQKSIHKTVNVLHVHENTCAYHTSLIQKSLSNKERKEPTQLHS